MQKKAVWTALLAAAFLISTQGCNKDAGNPYGSNSAPTSAGLPTNSVQMAGMAFSPTEIRITKNTTVTWVNNDGLVHTSTSDTGAWDTGDIQPNGKATTTFATAGTFPFHCTHHSTMMKGTVIVQ